MIAFICAGRHDVLTMPESMPSVTRAVIPVVEAIIRYIPVPNAFGPGDNFSRSKPWKLGVRAPPKMG